MGLWFPRPPRRPPRPLRQKVAGGVGVQVDYEHCTRPPRSPVPGARRRRSVCRSSISLLSPSHSRPIFPHRRRATVRTPELVQAGGRQLPFLQHSGCGRGVDRGHGTRVCCPGEHGQRGEREDGCLATLISSWKFPLSSSSRVEHGAEVRERARYRKERKRTERPPASPCVGVVIWWPSVCRTGTTSLPLSPHSQYRLEGGRAGRLSRSPTAMPGSRTPRWR